MKYVNFKKVHIKNFLSVGETPVTVDFNRGLNIITGMNKDKLDRRNGVGKSTVADSIYFAIFGTTLRELKKDHIINNISQRGCEVKLEFEVNVDGNVSEYVIVRSISPTKCMLTENGQDITRDSIANTTEFVAKLLSTTPEIFQNCVIMTINNATPFMAKKKLEKRKFIEGIFNLQVFSNMLTLARQEYNKVSRELDVECARYEEISNNISITHEQKKEQELNKQRAIEKLKARKKANDRSLSELKQKSDSIETIDLSVISEKLKKYESYSNEIEQKTHDMLKRLSKYKTLITVNQSKIEKLGTSDAQCPVCLSTIDETHKNHIQEEKDKITEQIKELNEKHDKTAAKLKAAKRILQEIKTDKNKQQEKINTYQISQQNLKNISAQIDQINTNNNDIDDDIESLKSQNTSIDNVIKEHETRLENTQQTINKIKSTINKLDIIKFVVSEEGVKSYIVKKILQLFNAKLSHYLKKMDSNCICIFNEYFEEEIINEKGKPCSYNNFSGAERKNIDLACLFAFMDIRRLQGDVAFNFSIYDELFDSSLDERGVELVIEILKERIEQHNECVMVISHRKESTKLATGEIIFLQKQNGVTTRVDTPMNELK